MAETSIIVLHPSRWREAKQLRLEALQNNPESFASSYEDALSFSDELWQDRVKTALEREGAMALYAEVAGSLVGMAGAGWSDRRKTRHVAEVYAVYVKPNHRGKGIGAALVQGLLDELKALPQIEKVKLSVTGSNQAAVALYRRLGFEIVGNAKRALKIDERYYDLHHMELWLR
ncbi:MAG: GNAT family N-acetyltransferase [Chloroflexi bacterium]|nr:GNAT family N-acetyltransferase [Chloroflexota bacterium]